MKEMLGLNEGLRLLLVVFVSVGATLVITERHVPGVSPSCPDIGKGEEDPVLRVALSQSQKDGGILQSQLELLTGDLAATKRSLTACQMAEDESAGRGGQLAKLQLEMEKLQAAYDAQAKEKVAGLGNCSDWEAHIFSQNAVKAAEQAVAACSQVAAPCPTPSTTSGATPGTLPTSGQDPRLYACSATEEELAQYMNYTARAICPDDWYTTQRLVFDKGCVGLPKRRCRAPMPLATSLRLPRPASLWSGAALADENVRWNLHQCKSYACVQSRARGDCGGCFSMDNEAKRWESEPNELSGVLSVENVIRMSLTGSIDGDMNGPLPKGGVSGPLRIGLDAGGGTGTFAAKMAAYNVTIVTTAMNTEAYQFGQEGLPYMETIALRGLVPLHWPHLARLPFFDGTLDIVHTAFSIKFFSMLAFEELLFDYDRVLRPGGLIWLDQFYASGQDIPLYLALIDLLQYKRLYWKLMPKTDSGNRGQLLFNCLLQKSS
eukprot:jgi/Mesen1/7586/ME000393S06679